MMQPAATGAATPATTAVVVSTPIPKPVSIVGLDWTVLVPLIFAGFATLATSIIGALKSYSNGKKGDAIHVLVNSGMSKAVSDLATAQEEIRTLRELVNALNIRITTQPLPGVLPIDVSLLPSPEVLAAQARTPPTPLPFLPPIPVITKG